MTPSPDSEIAPPAWPDGSTEPRTIWMCDTCGLISGLAFGCHSAEYDEHDRPAVPVLVVPYTNQEETR